MVWGTNLAKNPNDFILQTNPWTNSWTVSLGSYVNVRCKRKGVGGTADVREGGQQQNRGSLDLDQFQMSHTFLSLKPA